MRLEDDLTATHDIREVAVSAAPIVVDIPSELPAPRASRGRPRLLTWRRLFALAFAAATLVFTLTRPNGGGIGAWAFEAGAAIVLLGEGLRVWGCGHLRKNQEVVSSGPDAHVRNPLYLGTLLILVGFCVAAGNPLVLYALLPVGLVVFFAYYAPKKERVESERLRRRFGEQADVYRAAVPGYLPRLSRWKHASRARWSASLVVENTELPTAAIVAAALAAISFIA